MHIDLQTNTTAENLPGSEDFQRWVSLALSTLGKDTEVELTIRLTDNTEIQQLNRDYRGKDKPTNILSFPFEAIDIDPMELQMAYAGDAAQLDLPLLGDLVIAVSVIATEAAEQGKNLSDHYAHITVHGLLHLLGYDHIDDDEAEAMEALEIKILDQLGINNPYVA